MMDDLMEKARRYLVGLTDEEMSVEAAKTMIDWTREARLGAPAAKPTTQPAIGQKVKL
jgi:hypothetical protein